jgi:chitodextrinase
MSHDQPVTSCNRPPSAILAVLTLGLALTLTGCDALPPTSLAPDGAPQLSAQVAGDVIPGRFIVTVRAGVDPVAVAVNHGVSPEYVYTHALNGFAGEVRDAARSGLLRDARVLRVEPDRWASTDGIQPGAPWHLDRIDERVRLMDGYYHYNRTGAGVTVYVIDSGVRVTHSEFGGRASNAVDFVWTDSTESKKGDAEYVDCRDHGTSVAALVGGNTAGVARAVSLVSVRVMNCDGQSPFSRIIAGVDWVTQNSVPPAVANMSLGGGTSESMDDAVRNSIAAGVTYTISAGNSGADRPPRVQLACNRSPARVREALTAAATDQLDQKPSWSSYGECVDLFAPGEGISTASSAGDDAWRTGRWGTSFSAPLVAGVAALYLQEEPNALPAQVFAAVINATTKSIVTNPGSGTSNNHLLFSLAWADSTEPPPPPPPPSAPSAPSDLTATAVSASQIDLAWTDNSDDEDGFRIERCTGGGCADFTLLVNMGQNVTAHSDGGLTAETTYRYRVAAFNNGGPSDWSNVVEATTEAPPPVEPTGPTAMFDVDCVGLVCTFTDRSTPGDSDITAWSWDFGDGIGSNDQSPTHTYSADSTYTVVLTVTDGNNLTDNTTKVVSVAAGGPGPGPEQPDIDLFDLTNTSNPQFARVLVKWQVSGVDLQTVEVKVTGVNNGNSDVRTWAVSGTSATGQHDFSFRNGHGSYAVTLTVTAGGVEPVSAAEAIVLSR